jgi:hypothetical protein
MDKIKILVACHKPGAVYSDDVYTPIHVGRAVSPFKDVMGNMIGDDTGDNLSEKNPMYCELTAQYWAWRNLKNVEYVGFCHYRRFFDIQTKDILDTLRGNDAIVLKFVYNHPIWQEIVHFVSVEDLTILLMVLKNKYPEYEQTVIDYLYGNILYPKNMFICNKLLFDEYASWLFDVLSECEKNIKPSPYTRGKRTLAYLGEYLLSIYLMHNNLRLKVVECVDNVGHQNHTTYKHKMKIKMMSMNRLVSDMLFVKKPKTFEEMYLPEVLVGFKNDGIYV